MKNVRARSESAAALLVVDVQRGLDDPRYGVRNNAQAEQRIAELLDAWRTSRWPVIHVQHMSRERDSPLRPESPGNAFKHQALPRDGEPVFRKTVNSAFVGTTLEQHLRSEGIRTLVVVGLTTDHCVSSTVRTAADLGFEVVVVEDATATFERIGPDGLRYSARQMHGAALASLREEFAEVRCTRDVLAPLRPGAE